MVIGTSRKKARTILYVLGGAWCFALLDLLTQYLFGSAIFPHPSGNRDYWLIEVAASTTIVIGLWEGFKRAIK